MPKAPGQNWKRRWAVSPPVRVPLSDIGAVNAIAGILANGYLGRLHWHHYDLFAPRIEIARPLRLSRLAIAVMFKQF